MKWYALDVTCEREAREAVEYALMEAGALGTEARRDIERLVGHKVYLELFVKVEEGWRDSPRALSEMGIDE